MEASLELVQSGPPRGGAPVPFAWCRVESRAGRAVVLGAAVAIGGCSLSACGEGEREPEMPELAAASVPEDSEIEELVPLEDDDSLALDADEGRLGTFAASPGFTPDPLIHEGTTVAGVIDAETVDERCRGWLSSQPDFVLDASWPFAELALMVRSEADTTLVIVGPDGELRCGDDEDGAQPVVRGLFEPGTYRVWVGTRAPDVSVPYALALSELEETSPSRLH